MAWTSRVLHSLRLIAAGFALAATLWGQFGSYPEAKTPAEFDAYLRVLDAATPAGVIASGEAFLRDWPSSALRGAVYEMQFQAYRKTGEVGNAIQAAGNALRAAPDNLAVLTELALVLANATSDPARLAGARQNALKVIELSKNFRVPKSMPPQEWDRICGQLNSRAHAALGLVENANGRTQAAIREFETAVALAPVPDATQYYRLGLLYRVAGNIPAAIRSLKRAAELEDGVIQKLASKELSVLTPR